MATKFVAPVTALELLVIVSSVGKPCGENVCSVEKPASAEVCRRRIAAYGPVVQRLISPNPGLNFNSGFFISLSKILWENFHYSF